MSNVPNQPVSAWQAQLFAAVDAERKSNCAKACAASGDPFCFTSLADDYRDNECAAGCATRAILAALRPTASPAPTDPPFVGAAKGDLGLVDFDKIMTALAECACELEATAPFMHEQSKPDMRRAAGKARDAIDHITALRNPKP